MKIAKEYAKKCNVNLYELFSVWGQARHIRPSEMTEADVDRFIIARAKENWHEALCSAAPCDRAGAGIKERQMTKYLFEGECKGGIHVADALAHNIERVNRGCSVTPRTLPACHYNEYAGFIVSIPEETTLSYLVIPAWATCKNLKRDKVVKGRDNHFYGIYFLPATQLAGGGI